jgi:hypothetical protein
VTSRCVLQLLLASLALASAPSCLGGDLAGTRPRVVDPARVKAREADRQRLLAKLRDDVPKTFDTPAPADPLDAPIFHRHDRR